MLVSIAFTGSEPEPCPTCHVMKNLRALLFQNRFDAAEGPSCSSAINTIPNPDGLCVCDFDTQEQNTAFGCAARLLPSQAVTRRRIARNRIMPGMVKKAFFEEQRRNIRTGRTLQAADI